jgi:hypothetical protein
MYEMRTGWNKSSFSRSESYNAERRKFEAFLDRYDLVASDKRVLMVTVGDSAPEDSGMPRSGRAG